jgi:hypothetical protein
MNLKLEQQQKKYRIANIEQTKCKLNNAELNCRQ